MRTANYFLIVLFSLFSAGCATSKTQTPALVKVNVGKSGWDLDLYISFPAGYTVYDETEGAVGTAVDREGRPVTRIPGEVVGLRVLRGGVDVGFIRSRPGGRDTSVLVVAPLGHLEKFWRIAEQRTGKAARKTPGDSTWIGRQINACQVFGTSPFGRPIIGRVVDVRGQFLLCITEASWISDFLGVACLAGRLIDKSILPTGRGQLEEFETGGLVGEVDFCGSDWFRVHVGQVPAAARCTFGFRGKNEVLKTTFSACLTGHIASKMGMKFFNWAWGDALISGHDEVKVLVEVKSHSRGLITKEELRVHWGWNALKRLLAEQLRTIDESRIGSMSFTAIQQ